MSNRVFVLMEDGLNEPEWFSKIEPFLNSVMEKLNFSNEEVRESKGVLILNFLKLQNILHFLKAFQDLLRYHRHFSTFLRLRIQGHFQKKEHRLNCQYCGIENLEL